MNKMTLAIGLSALACITSMSACSAFEKVDWPRKLECVPPTADLISLVGAAMRDEDWRSQLEEMALDKDSGAVLCAVRQIVEDLSSDTAASPETRTVVARGELLLAESGTSFE